MRFLAMAALSAATLWAQHTPENDKNPFAADPAAAGKGRELYGQICVACHGAEGRGDRGPALANAAFKHGDSDGAIFLSIRNGVRGTQMPAFADFKADQVWQLVSYIRSLNRTAAKAAGPVAVAPELTGDRIARARTEPANWLTYWGDYGGQHYSPLAQITTANVRQLQARWALQIPGDSVVESVPLVVNGVMYTTGQPGQVGAIDAATGRLLWRYERKQKAVNPYEGNRVVRGVAVLGNRVFFGTLDAALVALDAQSGAVVWETQVADTMQGYSITGAPLAVKNMVITGIAGGEYGIRGFIDAYDAATGKRLWRFHTTAGSGEFGSETWAADSWQRGGGATWLTGSYDPALNLLYWGVGNPGPDLNGDVRKGDNLFTCSVVALDADTGQRKWHYQFTANDTHDWDATEDMVLVDRMYQGKMRKLLLHADRNGVFYALDRTDGKFLSAVPFVHTTWVKEWDASGRPVTIPGWRSTPEGSVVYPALVGGTNFQAPSYSAQTGWFYVAYHDGGGQFSSGPAPFEPGKQYWGRGATAGFEGLAGLPETQGIQAIDPSTGKPMWKHELAENSLASGVLATAGGLVFAASHTGDFLALDARTGRTLWHFQAGGDIPSSPMSYSVNGKQYVAISSAGVLYTFALPE
ncbi:MAG TPA: PQQ-dependent dehydrogenase, methanol/ethanol family [Candidatus Sulfopaludibacter sp.]|jgi:alcohol dehydrogenase (cytochrome c)|nr:PQQ-dependent dehydrogenase, methanol/ethanol family [Candidatus Sulfopaludibacter sp.]